MKTTPILIQTDLQYSFFMDLCETLMDGDPEKNTPQGQALLKVVAEIKKYEDISCGPPPSPIAGNSSKYQKPHDPNDDPADRGKAVR